MADFPASSVPENQTFLSVHTLSSCGVGMDIHIMSAAAQPASTTWVANLAIYQPITLPWPYTIRRFFFYNGATLTGPPNAQVGLYTPDGVLVCSCANTAQSGAGAVQFVAASTETRVPPGRYYLGYSNSAALADTFCSATVTANALRNLQVMQQATANPLPAIATFAANTNVLLPFVGFTRTASGG